VHGMTHMPALDARSCVLRGDVPGHHLPGRGCVGSTRTSVPLRGGVCHIRLDLEFGPWWPKYMLMRYCEEFSPTFVVKGGINQHIRLLKSIPSSRVKPFTRSEDKSVSRIVVGVVHSVCRVDLSRLDSRALQKIVTPQNL
jgi:hypothetical protein